MADAANTAGLKAKEADALVKKGMDLPEVGKQIGIQVKTSEPFTFFSYVQKENGNTAFASAAFLLPTGKTSGLIEDINPKTGNLSGYYIIKVLGKSGIDEGKYLAEKDQVMKALVQMREKQAFQEWVNSLMKRSNITRNEKLIQSYYG